MIFINHELRHTFASILINQDVPLLNVSTFLGHSDLSTTANIYAHLDKSKKQESADVILIKQKNNALHLGRIFADRKDDFIYD
ncbi:MAG: tyrosine-type recombinase/integrase [Oscillospiraceae bacterium]|nr:MAG: tyrosine-type recombinase/integrase [Oscillospiraceae bacterium]